MYRPPILFTCIGYRHAIHPFSRKECDAINIMTIKHKALERLFAAKPGAAVKGLDPLAAKKIRRMVAVLEASDHPNELRNDHPGWNVHELTPGSPGKWALNVTANYRLTFKLEGKEIFDLDFEDYH